MNTNKIMDGYLNVSYMLRSGTDRLTQRQVDTINRFIDFTFTRQQVDNIMVNTEGIFISGYPFKVNTVHQEVLTYISSYLINNPSYVDVLVKLDRVLKHLPGIRNVEFDTDFSIVYNTLGSSKQYCKQINTRDNINSWEEIKALVNVGTNAML